MSFFNKDLANEAVLANFLDKYFYPKSPFQNITRHADQQNQKAGIDISFDFQGNKLLVDEKGYLTRPTIQETFVLELSYLNKFQTRTEGWFYDSAKDTTHYLLCWADRKDIDIYKETLSIDHIYKVEVMLVNRATLQNYLNNTYNINREQIRNNSDALINQLTNDSNQQRLPKSQSKYMLSTKLREKPLNIVLTKNEYIQSESVEAHYIVTPSEVREVD